LALEINIPLLYLPLVEFCFTKFVILKNFCTELKDLMPKQENVAVTALDLYFGGSLLEFWWGHQLSGQFFFVLTDAGIIPKML
jgi:hypothetical protein